MSRQPRPDPTRIGDGGRTVFCLGCGEKVTIELPVRLNVYTAMLTAFAKAHRNCPMPVAEVAGKERADG